MTDERNKERDNDKPLPPDQETLHTTDPQEHMEGPVSSLMHETGDGFDTEESKKQADEEKDRKM